MSTSSIDDDSIRSDRPGIAYLGSDTEAEADKAKKKSKYNWKSMKFVTNVSKKVTKEVVGLTGEVIDVSKAIAKPVVGLTVDMSKALIDPMAELGERSIRILDFSDDKAKPEEEEEEEEEPVIKGPPVYQRTNTKGSVELIPEVYTDTGVRRRANINGTAMTLGLEQASADYLDMVEKIRVQEWMGSFRRMDPRYRILKYFDDVATLGTSRLRGSGRMDTNKLCPALRVFKRSAVFSVWRPTSKDSIKKMILGHGTGKGLDIKGKSAKVGKLSAFVPFVQIHEEHHKHKVKTLQKDGTIRVFYKKADSRDEAKKRLETMREKMLATVDKANQFLERENNAQNGASGVVMEGVFGLQVKEDSKDDFCDEEEALQALLWDFEYKEVITIDDYAPQCYGLMLSKRLFWEVYVMQQDISRPPGSTYDTGRPSMPAFQDMNFYSIKNHDPDEDNSLINNDKPKAVVWQYTDPYNDPNEPDPDPMLPQTLLMAYEECGRVLPVVSDFDCFLVGTRAVKYTQPLPKPQVELIKWNLDEIEKILEMPLASEGWASRWLRALKDVKAHAHKVAMPAYGYGDAVSYQMMQHAVRRLNKTGAVRHGAECFNYYFPQDLDDEFLIISEVFLHEKYKSPKHGNVPWRYVNQEELKDFLYNQIGQGFTFPLNPKWVLCDQGWKKVYDELMRSTKPNVQSSLDAWFPPESGIRERIEEISANHPEGLKFLQAEKVKKNRGTQVMDLAELELTRYLTLQRAKRKLRMILFWISLGQKAKRKREAMEAAEKLNNTNEESKDSLMNE